MSDTPAWIGKLPDDWECKKIKRLCITRRGASPRPIDDPIYFDDNGNRGWVRISDVTASGKYLLQTEQRLSAIGESKSVPLEPGELFVSIAGSVGKPIIAGVPCCIHDGFVYFVGLKENPEFLYYIFASGEPYKGLGKLGTQLNLNTDTIGDIQVPMPNRITQNQIVAFLDRKTTKADALVAKYEKLIELLEEKRVVLIAQAVTKGLDPTVPMRHSGVEWMGSIPDHWTVTPLRYLVQCLDGKRVPLNAEERGKMQGCYPYWGANGIVDYLDAYIFDEELVLLGEDGAPFFEVLRDVAFVVNEKVWVNNHIHVLRPFREQITASFLAHCLNRNNWGHFIEGSTRDKLTQDAMRSIPIAVPPVEEQAAICTFIEANLTPIVKLIAKAERAIALTREHRSALITAAVTGQINARAYKREDIAVPA